jgi:glucose-6-phosphate 1-epimerase
MDTEEANLASLRERFAVPGVLAFAQAASGLVFARVTSAAAAATVYLQGAHLAEWRPAGEQPVLFLSARSEYVPGKAIRGGVPVIFPWFGPRHDGKAGPQHGFARTSVWELAFAAVAGDEVHLTFTLGPNEVSRALGFDHFRVAYRMTIGKRLRLEMMVANDLDAAEGEGAALVFEEALHTYLAVSDVERVELMGLGGTAYLDKRDEAKRKVQPDGAVRLTEITDRVYLETTATCVVEDAGAGRRIVVEKAGSHATVVWNPWAEATAKMGDMEPDGWRGMLCVESANVEEGAVSLKPGETHTMRVEIWVEAMA